MKTNPNITLKNAITGALATALLFAISSPLHALKSKGPGQHCQNDSCDTFRINHTSAQIAPSLIKPPAGSQASIPIMVLDTSNSTTLNTRQVDVDIRMTYSEREQNGNGRDYILDNNSTLYNGDEFAFEVQAYNNLYFYLYHTDPVGKEAELINKLKGNNYFKAGSVQHLPSRKQFFRLDGCTGKETILLVYSKNKLLHKPNINDNSMQLASRAKGFYVAGPKDISLNLHGARTKACPSDADYCYELVTINHESVMGKSSC